MPLEVQAKVLRFLQDHKYQKLGDNQFIKSNIRIICATNKNPHDQIKSKLFRQDLFYRLFVIPISMPGLKERGEDILTLVDYFLSFYSEKEGKNFEGFTTRAEDILKNYSWPGNVRELKNIIHQAVVLYNENEVKAAMLPASLQHEKNACQVTQERIAQVPLWKIEKQAIEKAIKSCNGNIIQAAAMLEISPSTIYRKKMQWENPQDTA